MARFKNSAKMKYGEKEMSIDRDLETPNTIERLLLRLISRLYGKRFHDLLDGYAAQLKQ